MREGKGPAGIVKECEEELEQILSGVEMKGRLSEALDAYQGVEARTARLGVRPEDPDYRELQRVVAFCFLRQANLLRQMGRLDEARLLSEKELAAARASGDGITLARSLISQGATRIASRDVDRGLRMVEEARTLFEKGDGIDYRQGLGWYWILKADLNNAGLVPKDPRMAVDAANHAITILERIENWPGVARAYGARAIAHEALGDKESAARDNEAKSSCEKKIVSPED